MQNQLPLKHNIMIIKGLGMTQPDLNVSEQRDTNAFIFFDFSHDFCNI
jgi:hypothetical protein